LTIKPKKKTNRGELVVGRGLVGKTAVVVFGEDCSWLGRWPAVSAVRIYIRQGTGSSDEYGYVFLFFFFLLRDFLKRRAGWFFSG
jgi:hypothetical protein